MCNNLDLVYFFQSWINRGGRHLKAIFHWHRVSVESGNLNGRHGYRVKFRKCRPIGLSEVQVCTMSEKYRRKTQGEFSRTTRSTACCHPLVRRENSVPGQETLLFSSPPRSRIRSRNRLIYILGFYYIEKKKRRNNETGQRSEKWSTMPIQRRRWFVLTRGRQ